MDFVATNSFDRLRRLINHCSPPTNCTPIKLHLGEQQLVIPTEILGTIKSGTGWSHYPPLGGSLSLREAYIHWLQRHFGVGSEILAGNIACEPTPGSKQGIASAISLAVLHSFRKNNSVPAIALPDFSYPTYRTAALMSGAEIIIFNPEREDLDEQIQKKLACRNVSLAAIIVCNPGNPTGLILKKHQLTKLVKLAERHTARVIVDECYIDLWLERPIDSALQLIVKSKYSCPLVVLHTLSKRSGAPGLRSGFMTGTPASIEDYANFNRTCGVSLASPVCSISAKLWQNEAHVDHLRLALRETWQIADTLMQELPGYQRAEAGFFLWLPVEDCETTAKKLWCEAGVLTMPGLYLIPENFNTNDCKKTVAIARKHLRIALVHPPKTLTVALTRLRAVIRDCA